jgi:hypothetical protein
MPGLGELAHNRHTKKRGEAMAETTFDKVLTDALALPPDEQRRLAEALMAGAGVIQPLKSLEQLMAEQGTRPLSFAEMLGPEGMWPEDDDVDDFLAEVRQWRDEDSGRSLER